MLVPSALHWWAKVGNDRSSAALYGQGGVGPEVHAALQFCSKKKKIPYLYQFFGRLNSPEHKHKLAHTDVIVEWLTTIDLLILTMRLILA